MANPCDINYIYYQLNFKTHILLKPPSIITKTASMPNLHPNVNEYIVIRNDLVIFEEEAD